MKNRERQQLLEIVDAVLDGVRQCVHLESDSVTRMVGEIAEALPLFGAPEIAAQTEAVAASLTRLVEGTGDAEEAVSRVRDLKAALQAIEPTYTVVFLPYNAAMWDSLHTIWQAADADPRCEAIVVPIPFAELTPERTLKEWRLHAKDFPADVPVVDHATFDLSAVHPDIVYVHNPYDGYNTVTSVHPDYYSDVLKEHCELLVYVPYWVSANAVAENFDAHPSFEHFDKVIYQSEQFAQRAISLWSSNKIVPLGSPKLDYVRTTGGPIPPAWADKMAGRTTLLALTSLHTLLQFRGESISKLDDVLDVVQRSEDLALWWRPHPLETATIDSKMPELRSSYDAVLSRARGMSRVIVDTSMDLQRAIHRTDAYYGHWSSVITLYGSTGKPMVIQDPPVRAEIPCADRPAVPDEAFRRYALAEKHLDIGAVAHLLAACARNGGQVAGQAEWFRATAANSDGTAGRRIHEYVTGALRERQ